MDATRSRELFERALQRIPGGVNSPVRAFKAVGGEPRFIDHGEGAYLVDVDGHRYVDHVMSWGALSLGHAHPSVTKLYARLAPKPLGRAIGKPDPIVVFAFLGA